MQDFSLTAISPLDGRYAEKTKALRQLTSEHGLIYYRVLVEIKWLVMLANNSAISELTALTQQQQQYLDNISNHFTLQHSQHIKDIEKTSNHDVKAVEYFIRDRIQAEPSLHPLLAYIHFACTSEDINNLAYALMLQDTRQQVILPALDNIQQDLQQKAQQYADLAMLARTHGQTATPTTLGKEFANVAARLARQIKQLKAIEILGKFNGAVGNYNAHHAAFPDIDWQAFNEQFVKSLGLSFNPMTTQIEPHDYIAELLQCISRINTILLDLARDIWSYVSIAYFQQSSDPNEVGSSTMPHKVNPIDFENAEGNLGIANALNEHLAMKLPISRWQRDLSDSTVLRNLGSAIGYSLLAYQALQKGLGKITANTAVISNDLESRWEVLAEAVQTVMRRYGVVDAYEQLKTLTRGKAITAEIIRNFVEQSTQLPTAAKTALLALTPSTYTGYAATLAEKSNMG